MPRVAGKSLRTIKPEVVTSLRKKLNGLPKVEEMTLSKTDVIRGLRKEIEAARVDKGYSYQQIAKMLSESGVSVNARAIQVALTTADSDGARRETNAETDAKG
jgi:ribosome-binding protein aMBF1 (putative translation factor)